MKAANSKSEFRTLNANLMVLAAADRHFTSSNEAQERSAGSLSIRLMAALIQHSSRLPLFDHK
jgi:hypothetical protein